MPTKRITHIETDGPLRVNRLELRDQDGASLCGRILPKAGMVPANVSMLGILDWDDVCRQCKKIRGWHIEAATQRAYERRVKNGNR